MYFYGCFSEKIGYFLSRAEFHPLQFLINNEKAIRHNYYTHKKQTSKRIFLSELLLVIIGADK